MTINYVDGDSHGPSTGTTYKDKPAGLPCPDSSASFWHSQPNHFLLNHRTTKLLPETADIVIVGSGITGASAARFLSEDGRAANMKIVMLEAREACWGATGRNGGHCQALTYDRTPDVAAFEFKNVSMVHDYIQQHGIDCWWRKVTACRIFWNQKVFDVAKEAIKHLTTTQPDVAKKVKVVDGSEKEILKSVRVKEGVVGVTLTEGALQLWPYKYVTFILEKMVKERKLHLHTNTPVTRIEPVSDYYAYRHKLHTPRGVILAQNVILATNGYTSHLLHDFQSLIVPMRCEMSALHPPEGSARLSNSYGMTGFQGGHPEHSDYLVQLPFSETADGRRCGGQLMYGGGHDHATYGLLGETDDNVVDIGEAKYLRRSLLEMLDLGGNSADLQELRASHQWTGIKGMSRDNLPWVGMVPRKEGATWRWEDGLYLAGGYSGHGMPNASLCGKAVVEMVLSQNNSDSTSYDAVCEQLVKANDIPQSYLITVHRLDAVLKMPTVAEQDQQGERSKHSTRQEVLNGNK